MGPGAAGPSPKIAAVNRWGPGFTILQPERNSSSLARVRVRNSGCVRDFIGDWKRWSHAERVLAIVVTLLMVAVPLVLLAAGKAGI
jgi:hypothetical protein